MKRRHLWAALRRLTKRGNMVSPAQAVRPTVTRNGVPLDGPDPEDALDELRDALAWAGFGSVKLRVMEHQQESFYGLSPHHGPPSVVAEMSATVAVFLAEAVRKVADR